MIFIEPGATVAHLHGSHHTGLVLLSLFVSVFSATMALKTVQIASHAEIRLYRMVAIITGAVALGGGIWAMHFIGMLAFELPTQVRYAPGLTLFSLLPAFAASWWALSLLARPEVGWRQLLPGGLLVGLGIGTMHYTGMAAMRTPLEMRYEPLMFGLSLVLAVGLATLALWVRHGLRHTRLGGGGQQLLSGLVMGAAIASMHYTGMSAVRFIGDPGEPSSHLLLDNTVASVALAAFSIAVTLLVSALNGLIRLREVNRGMEESRLRLQATLDTAIDGIITIDSRGLMQSFNHSAERLFGRRAEEVLGRNIKMLMPEPYQSAHDGYLQNYRESGIPSIIGKGREVIGLRKDGSLMPMRLAVGRVDLPGELLFVGFVSDISERHALEASLRETAERAERAAAAKSTFLANMSHEIRTPMNSIIGFTELLLQTGLTPVQQTHLGTIRQSAKSLLELINDILDTTRMEKGGLELEVIDFSLKGLALQIESSLRLGAMAKKLTLSTHYPAGMPQVFRGDPLRILQVLTNLVGNAIKFTPRGGVDVMFSHEDGQVCIKVMDTGIGMTAQQAEAIFAPFTQADASISRRFGGTGLGTTIARQLVELMGGVIEVQSEPGQGSTFLVRLPLPLGEAPAEGRSDRALPGLPPLRILIADDVPQNLELLMLTLEGGGHRVTAVSDGEEALGKVRAERYDIVLMDVHMPGTDGLQATRLIRRHERAQGLAPTPIIALTASVMDEDKRAARAAGMDGFAVKPLDVARLFEEIARVLRLRAAGPDGGRRDGPPGSQVRWAAGIERWGDEPRLRAALRQFLAEQPERHPLPADGGGAAAWPDDALAASLHGIRGSAGNLALVQVAELAGAMEDAIRAGRRDEAVAQLPRLWDLLALASREFPPCHDEDAAVPPEPGVDVQLPDELREDLRALRAVLERQEFDDAALMRVSAGLERLGARAAARDLRSAVEAFEFARARQLLAELLDGAAQPAAVSEKAS